MANSLIELYGGGMAGKSNNYQLGGRVASAKRRRDYQGERRELLGKQEEANRRKKRSGTLGSIGSILGGIAGAALAPVTGGASLALATGLGAGLGRAAGESTYKREDFGGGKYAQETRGELGRGEDEYRRSIGERALVTGLQSAVMPGMFQKAAGGLGKVGAAFGEAQTSAELFGFGEGLKEFGRELGTQFGGRMPVEMLSAPTTLASSVIPEVTSAVSPTVSTAPATLVPEGVDFLSGGFDLSTTAQPQANPYEYFGPFFNRGGGLIDMNTPQYQNGGMIRERYDAMNRPTSFGNQVNSAGEMRNLYGQLTQSQNPYTPPTSPPTPQTPYTPPTPPPAPYTPGYGTATNVAGALTQMGMGDIANDPRFAQYADDLPDFQMGYAQQVGDIYSGARQSARGMRGQQMQAAGQRGFAGSGIGQRQTQQAFGDLRTDVARQRRGVVEGFQADLLSAIGDIEAKGQFEFGGASPASNLIVQSVEDYMQNNPSLTREQAEIQYEQDRQSYERGMYD